MNPFSPATCEPVPIKHVARAHEQLTVYSMGKRFRVQAVFTTDDDANEYCARNGCNGAVIAVFGPFIIVADKYAGQP